MSRRAFATGVLAPFAGALPLAIAVVIAGCSADVTRFSLGSFGTDTTASTNPMPYAPTKFASYSPAPTAYAPPKAYGPTPIETAQPPVPPKDYRVVGRIYDPPPPSKEPPYTSPPYTPPPPLIGAPFKQPAAAGPLSGPTQPPPSVGVVEVQPGDTLYSIARRFGVTASAIKELNDLPSTSVRPGQRLTIPAEANDPGPLAKAVPPGKAAPPMGEATGAKFPSAKEVPVPLGDPPSALPPRVVQVKPRIIKAEETPATEAKLKTAKRSDTVTDAMPAPAVSGGKFRWPLRGRVIVAFGTLPDGSKNDGITLAAPLGTDIHAAEAGRVHYVGALKGYGNMVLIRHANDWATAYGYVDQILVKVNDEVKRGDVIAKVGKSGPVVQPQLKFELRKASVPVDPVAHLAN